MEKAKITFSNGNEISVEKNGDAYIVASKDILDEAAGDSISATVVTDDETKEINPMEIIECASIDENYWFGLRQITEEELSALKLEAQVDYTAMMTDTIIEE